MVCFSLHLVKALPATAPHLINSLRRDGMFAEFKKHIGCSVLESDLKNNLYLIIDFFRSPYDFFESEVSPMGIIRTTLISRMKRLGINPYDYV